MLTLKNIATIRTGYPFRGAVELDPNGNTQVIQIKDITSDNNLSEANLARTNIKNLKETYLVQLNAVLLIARGERRQAVAITKKIENTIAGHQFFVITPNPNVKVLSEYLAWYINQKPAQKYLEQHSKGTNVVLVTKEVLEALPIALPFLEVQKKIVHIYQLSLKEQELLNAIKEKRSKLIEVLLINSLQINL
jgi:restriction endonuclease S subunit